MRPIRIHSGGIRCLGVLTAAALIGGCTGSPGPSRATPSPPTSPATTIGPDGFGIRSIRLTCADGVAATAADREGLRGDVAIQGLGSRGGPALLAEDAGLRLPPGRRWYFRKAPLIVRAGAPDVSLDVAGPEQALAWVPQTVWRAGGHPDLGPWAAGSVTLSACADRATLFLGGLLAADAATCLLVRLRVAGQAGSSIRQRLDGSPCPSGS